MRARLLMLDNAVHRLVFRPPWHWKPYLRAASVDVVNVPSGRPIPPLDGYTHVLVTGSEASILRPTSWFEREADLIREAVDRGLPVLASCFGHQMLVYALSGPEHLVRSPKPEIGWIALDVLEEDDLLADAPNPWHVFSYHFDEVGDPPSPWRVLARSRDCPTHIIRYGDRPIWGIQAHPELPLAKVRVFLTFYMMFAGRDRRKAFMAMRRPSREDRIMGTVVSRFLKTDQAG